MSGREARKQHIPRARTDRVERRSGVGWSAASFEDFTSKLGVSHACEAELALVKITESLCLHFHMNDARRKAKNARLVKNELEQALRSAIILRQFYAHRTPLTNYLMAKTDRYATLDDIRALNEGVESLNGTLSQIIAKAELILDDDLLFRQILGFPPSEQASRSSVAVLVWPTVFEVWEAAGRHVAKTPQGPLHRFLNLVHAAARLPEPNARTMRDAVDAWKSGGREEWARRAEIERRRVYGGGIMMREP